MDLRATVQPMVKTLAEFKIASEVTKCEVTLATRIGGVEKPTLFSILDEDMECNVILERPWLHATTSIQSIYHQVIKFLMSYDIK